MEPKKNLEKTKTVYKISDITELLKLTPRTLRYYESEGLLGRVKRTIGYTRYYTGEDIQQLKHIIKLKKKGLKIAQIKQRAKKFKLLPCTPLNFLSISDVLIDKTDIQQLLMMDIHIINSELVFNDVSLNYVDWKDIQLDQFLKPFEVVQKQPSPREVFLTVFKQSRWLGNGHRTIVNAMMAAYQQGENWTSDMIKTAINSLTEWLILPITVEGAAYVVTDYSLSFILEQRGQNNIKTIVQAEDVIDCLKKQLKDLILLTGGRMSQVTIHGNKKDPKLKKIIKDIVSLIPNKDLIKVEDISPIYIQSLGTTQAILMSVV